MKEHVIFGEVVSVDDVAELAGIGYDGAHHRLRKMSAVAAAILPGKALRSIEPGTRFGRMVVVSEAGRSNAGKRIYECLCECGAKKTVVGADLKSGQTRSCGCQKAEATKAAREKEAEDITGRVFASLRVIERGEMVETKRGPSGGMRHVRKWICECECGERISAPAAALRKGQITSCGCKKSERLRAAGRARAPRLPYFGESLTLREIAAVSGWDVPTLRYRIYKIGMTAEDAGTTKGLRPGPNPIAKVGPGKGGETQ